MIVICENIEFVTLINILYFTKQISFENCNFLLMIFKTFEIYCNLHLKNINYTKTQLEYTYKKNGEPNYYSNKVGNL